MRYMPTFRVPVFGSCVITAGRGVAGPAVLDRQEVEVHVVAFEHDVVMSRATDGLRPRVGDRLQRLQAADLLGQPLRGLHFEHQAELGGRVVETVDSEGQAHAPLGAELVDEERVPRTLRVLEEKRRSSRLDDAIGDLGDLEIGIDLGGDTPQLALLLEERNPLAEVSWRRHGAVSLGT